MRINELKISVLYIDLTLLMIAAAHIYWHTFSLTDNLIAGVLRYRLCVAIVDHWTLKYDEKTLL